MFFLLKKISYFFALQCMKIEELIDDLKTKIAFYKNLSLS